VRGSTLFPQRVAVGKLLEAVDSFRLIEERHRDRVSPSSSSSSPPPCFYLLACLFSYFFETIGVVLRQWSVIYILSVVECGVSWCSAFCRGKL
jgi:hypothetical protein